MTQEEAIRLVVPTRDLDEFTYFVHNRNLVAVRQQYLTWKNNKVIKANPSRYGR